MSTDDLESYEADLRLNLYREYRDVVGMFRFVIETERGVYLANEVTSSTEEVGVGSRPRSVLELRDAWVWDMYRPQRFVPSVRIVTSRDVVIEEIAGSELDLAKAGLDGSARGDAGAGAGDASATGSSGASDADGPGSAGGGGSQPGASPADGTDGEPT